MDSNRSTAADFSRTLREKLSVGDRPLTSAEQVLVVLAGQYKPAPKMSEIHIEVSETSRQDFPESFFVRIASSYTYSGKYPFPHSAHRQLPMIERFIENNPKKFLKIPDGEMNSISFLIKKNSMEGFLAQLGHPEKELSALIEPRTENKELYSSRIRRIQLADAAGSPNDKVPNEVTETFKFVSHKVVDRNSKIPIHGFAASDAEISNSVLLQAVEDEKGRSVLLLDGKPTRQCIVTRADYSEVRGVDVGQSDIPEIFHQVNTYSFRPDRVILVSERKTTLNRN